MSDTKTADRPNAIHLDVYRDPWIDVKYCDKHTDKLSLRECLAQAKNIESVSIRDARFALDKTVPYTLLTLIVARVFNPDDDKKLDMLDTGMFDLERIDAYIAECESQGVSFDVFDEEHPFLQDATGRYDPHAATVGMLDPFMVSGNNTVFYHNRTFNTNGNPVEETLRMTPAQFIASVARNHMYHISSGQSCSSGYASKQPPLHGILHVRNLFETIIMSIPDRLCGVPLWERPYDMTVPEIVSKYGHLDYISAAFLPTTSIRFECIEDGNVKTIQYHGNIYQGKEREKSKPANEYKESFLVPGETGFNLFFETGKDDSLFPIMLKSNCGDFTATKLQLMQTFSNFGNPQFIREAKEEGLLQPPFKLSVYGGVLSQQGVEPESMILDIPLPVELFNIEVSGYIKGIVNYVDLAMDTLRISLRNLEREIQNQDPQNGKLKESEAVRSIMRQFSQYACDQLMPNYLLHGTWIERIVAEPTKEKQMEIIEEVQKEAMKAYRSYRTHDIYPFAMYDSRLDRKLTQARTPKKEVKK